MSEADTKRRTVMLTVADIWHCPHVIMAASHYREDGTCRCNDPNDKAMAEWGYVWRNGEWRSP